MDKPKYDYPEYRKKYYQKKKLKFELKNDKFLDISNPFVVLFN